MMFSLIKIFSFGRSNATQTAPQFDPAALKTEIEGIEQRLRQYAFSEKVNSAALQVANTNYEEFKVLTPQPRGYANDLKVRLNLSLEAGKKWVLANSNFQKAYASYEQYVAKLPRELNYTLKLPSAFYTTVSAVALLVIASAFTLFSGKKQDAA